MNQGGQQLTVSKEMQVAKRHSAWAREQLETQQETLLAALPRTIPPERFIRTVCTAIISNPKIVGTTWESQVQAVIEASTLGLEPGTLGECYFVPYGQRCQMIPGYQGLIKLMRNSGEVAKIDVGDVREGETYVETPQGIKVNKVRDPNRHELPITWVFVSVTLMNGAVQSDMMSREEIDHHKEKTSAGWRKPDHPWQKWWRQMAIKTVIRRMFKYLPHSVELQRLGEREDKFLNATVDAQPTVIKTEDQMEHFQQAHQAAAAIAGQTVEADAVVHEPSEAPPEDDAVFHPEDSLPKAAQARIETYKKELAQAGHPDDVQAAFKKAKAAAPKNAQAERELISALAAAKEDEFFMQDEVKQ